MSLHRPPRWVEGLLRRLLPGEYAAEILGYLETDARRRFPADRARRSRIAVWYVRQVASPSMVALAWKLRGRRRGRGPDLAGDVAAAVRGLARHPLYTSLAVLSLGVGIGANAAIFGAVNGVLLRPLPYADPDRLAFVWNRIPGFDLPRLPLSGLQVAELRREVETFEDVGAIWGTTQTVHADGRAVLASSGLVTPNFFALLGVEPALGRAFTEAEGGTEETTVILSDAFWRTELGADPAVVGRSIRLQGGDATVVGVLPRGFQLVFPTDVGVPARPEVYVPYPWIATGEQGPRFLRTVARLRPGVSEQDADAVVKRVAARLRRTHAEIGETGDEFRVVALHADAVARVRPALLALMAGVLIFLLMTAGNVANLVLARGLARRREVAIRSCLGASTARLARLFVTEVALLTAAGTVAGLLLGTWSGQALWRLRPAALARVDQVGLDPTVFLFSLAVALLAGGVAALGVVFALRGRAPMDSLRRADGGRDAGSGRVRRGVVAAEMGLSVVLVVSAGLVGRSLIRLQGTELGFDPGRVVTFRVGLPQQRFPSDGERARLAREIEVGLSSDPTVVAAGATSHVPLADWANWSGSAAPEGTPAEAREGFHFDHRSITPGYLDAMGVRLIAGREFDESDDGSSRPVVIVDERLAEIAFPDGDPVGRLLVPTRYVDGGFEPTPALVVGVVEAVRDRSPSVPSSGQVFWPFAQSARWELTYVVRTRDDAAGLDERVRALVRQVSPDLAATDFRALGSYVDGSMAQARFIALLATSLSAVSLLLAALGLYGVMSYTTRRRTRDMGLQLALGARGRDLFAHVIAEGLGIGLVGVAAGLGAAALVTGYLDALLFEVDRLDPAVFVGVAAVLLGVAMAATCGPAVRAMRVDPVRSLRIE